MICRPMNPFNVSAHGVNADPLASITDNTNPGGATAWNDFYWNNVLAADAAAVTAVDCIDCTVSFDVTALVTDWIDGSNTLQFMAIAGANHDPASEIFHGFLNNTEHPGSTYLTIAPAAVPIPAAAWLFGSALLGLVGIGRRGSNARS